MHNHCASRLKAFVINYYRIKTIDKDGTSQYSSVVRVYIAKGTGEITIYPHPVTGNTISLRLSDLEKGRYTVTITNELGQQLYRSLFEHAGGSVTQLLRLTKTLPQGVYQLQVLSDKNNFTEQLIKN